MEHVQQMDDKRIYKTALKYRPGEWRNLKCPRKRLINQGSLSRQHFLLHKVEKETDSHSVMLTKNINITATLLGTLNLHCTVIDHVTENKCATLIIWKAAYS
jgi:hypothetical protein